MQFIQAPITAVLCLSLLGSSVPGIAQAPSAAQADPPSHPKARSEYRSNQLRGDDRILHALNRFAFGPRPGDLDAVRTIGLDKWFDQQLHPSGIDESVLDARLAQYPAMQLSPRDLLFRLPSNAVIRQDMNRREPIPERGFLHAVYQNQIDRVTARQQAKAENTAADAMPQQPASPASAPSKAVEPTMVTDAESPTPMARVPASADTQPAQMNAPTSEPGSTATIGTPSLRGTSARGWDPTNSNLLQPAPVDELLFHDLLALPPQQRLARLADLRQPELDAFLKSLRPAQRAQLAAGLEPAQEEQIEALAGPERLVVEELIAQRLTRDIYSNAQLQEVMTDFWLNHFNVYLRKNEATPYYLVSYERDVIRPLALGKFEDLLEATAHSPAMLLYLDNASSIGPHSIGRGARKDDACAPPRAKKKTPEGLNENYARELMELHTLGVNGGYTQADVTQVARILTGWTIDRPQRGGNSSSIPIATSPAPRKLWARNSKKKAKKKAASCSHFLATRPATAQFISRKLAIRFVSDDPPQPLVDRMARTYHVLRRRHPRDPQNPVALPRVLVRQHLSRQGQNTP